MNKAVNFHINGDGGAGEAIHMGRQEFARLFFVQHLVPAVPFGEVTSSVVRRHPCWDTIVRSEPISPYPEFIVTFLCVLELGANST